MILRVRNVQCRGCAAHVREALEGLDGVEEVRRVDVEDGSIDLDLDENTTTLTTVADTLAAAGFPVRISAASVSTGAGGDETSGRRAGEEGWSAALRFAVLALAALVVGLLGYVGYELYPRFDLPPVEGVALLALAAGAGVASFFSPCAFALLLAVVGRGVDAAARDGSGEGQRDRLNDGIGPALRRAAAVSLGATVFVVLVGGTLALGGRALVGDVVFGSTEGRILRAGVGLFLVAMGLLQTGLLPSPLHAVEDLVRPFMRLQAEQRRKRPFLGSAMFGFGYLLAGFG